MKSFSVPAWEWYSWANEELVFPDGWNVHEQRMKGHSTAALTGKQIEEKLASPVGCVPLHELAKGKRKCVIIFDDMTRPTKVYQVLPAVLKELHRGGIADDQVVFMMAAGAHHGRVLFDFQKKLGYEIPERYLVFNHNCYENLVDLGETSRGTPVHINREVMSCDLKVSVGCMIPHFGYGFGGGSKMLLPGVAGIDTITHNHRITEGTGPGLIEGNIRRLDSEEVARLAGLDFIVNIFPNAGCDAADLVSGDVVDAHREGVKIARRHYVTEVVKDADIAVGNGYPMSNEGYKAYHLLNESVREGGDMVFVIYTPEGGRVHHYNGRFGEDYGGRGWKPNKYVKKPWKMGRVLCVSPQMTKVDECLYGEGSTWVKTWEETLQLLKDEHGDEAKVALYPTAAMQVSERNAGLA